ncbi:MAG TPA: hypothetical protein VJU15_04390 [Gemmatimonadales bacterium]|nr:hypothetical protein [Gemmatimonadales bacterium]
MKLVAPGGLIVAVVVVLVAYVRIAWWGAPRFGEHFPWVAALGSVLVLGLVAALTRGAASPDELLFTRPSRAWLESGVLTALVTLPVFGFAARSVAKRIALNPAGPSLMDWFSSVFAGLFGIFFIVSVVIVLGVLVWK